MNPVNGKKLALLYRNAPHWAGQPGLNGVLLSFLLGLAGAAALFLPFLIIDKGFFVYCGDFNSQQIPFYYYVQQFVKTQAGTWSWATDLGSSVVNSYSFYNLGSPFLWLSTLFPSRWVPYMMAPMLILKFGCLSAAASLWLGRYAKTRNMTVICSLLYAFCGFNIYNIFFNHMLEPAILFPLMLWALDGFFYNRRRGLFAVTVGLSLLNSYFFFIGNVVFILLYFVVKLACNEYKTDLKTFALLAGESVLGVCLGMALALPAFYNLLGNPRVENFANGFGLLLYGRVQQYFAILWSLFFPPDPPYLPVLFPDAVIKWTSMSFYLPLVGMAGVFAYFRTRRGGSVKALLIISFIMALVPILNSSYYAFNASYYARWYYMPLLVACLATLRALEDADIDLKRGVKAVGLVTAAWAVFGLLPEKDSESGAWHIGLAETASKYWLTLLTALFGLAVCYILVKYYRGKTRFAPLMLSAVMGFSVFYGVIHMALAKLDQWERDIDYRQQQYIGANNLGLPSQDDVGFYRIDSYGAFDNLPLWANQSGLQCFNSVVTPSIMEFYPLVGVKRDVSSKPETENYALRGLLSCRYTVVPNGEADNFISAPGSMGWVHYKTSGPFTIYENQNHVPLGFVYDRYVRMANLNGMTVGDRAPILMRAIGLDAEQEGRFAHLFPEGQAAEWLPNTDPAPVGEEAASGYYSYDPVTYERYVQDCADRAQSAAYATYADATGFSCGIDLARDNLVFFGVPYDPGFTATVNGRSTEVLKVSGGMMAVAAPAGICEIVFTYRTPGLFAGAVVSCAALAVLAAYLPGVAWWRRRKAAAAGTDEEKTGDNNG